MTVFFLVSLCQENSLHSYHLIETDFAYRVVFKLPSEVGIWGPQAFHWGRIFQFSLTIATTH